MNKGNGEFKTECQMVSNSINIITVAIGGQTGKKIEATCKDREDAEGKTCNAGKGKLSWELRIACHHWGLGQRWTSPSAKSLLMITLYDVSLHMLLLLPQTFPSHGTSVQETWETWQIFRILKWEQWYYVRSKLCLWEPRTFQDTFSLYWI